MLEGFRIEPDNRVEHTSECPEGPSLWWRYDAFAVLGDSPSEDYVSIRPYPYRVVRETEKSVWVDNHSEIKRIQRDWKRKWAHPTKAEAREAYKRRLRWRKIYNELEARRIAVIERALGEVDASL